MLTVGNVVTYLQAQYATYPFYNGVIDRNKEKAIGVYLRSGSPVVLALGGKTNSSYGVLPINILIHWTQNSNTCEGIANTIYEFLLGKSNFMMGAIKVSSVQLFDSTPINIGRDEKNICEITIRADIIYNK